VLYKGEQQITFSDDNIREALLIFSLYVFSFIIGSVILMFHGYSVEASMFEFASAMDGVGLTAGVTTPDMPLTALWDLIIGMFAGRFEFLVIIYALARVFSDVKDSFTKSRNSISKKNLIILIIYLEGDCIMSNKTMIYLLIFVVVVFLVIDMVTLMMNRSNFTVQYYDTDIYTDYSETATITTVSGLVFKDQKKEDDYLKTYNETSVQTFEKYFTEISKEIGKTIKVLDVDMKTQKRDSVLEITETVTLGGLVTKDGDKFNLGMGDIQLNSVAQSNVRVHLPADAVIESTDPTPTKVVSNMVTWSGKDIARFPNIAFKRGGQ